MFIKEPKGRPKIKINDETSKVKFGLNVRKDSNKARPKKKYTLFNNKAEI